MTDEDIRFMREALTLAETAGDSGEVPVGSVVVENGTVIGRGANAVERDKDSSSHAEMLAMREAARTRGDWRLEGTTLYVTKEPCAMCAGAMVNARVARVVFGMPDPRSGCAGSALNVTGFPGMLHQLDAEGGILEEECRSVMQQFFRKVRKA